MTVSGLKSQCSPLCERMQGLFLSGSLFVCVCVFVYIDIYLVYNIILVVIVVKTPLADAGDIRDRGSITGSGRSPEGGHGNHSSILSWRIPWTEEPGGLRSIGL